MDQLSQTEATGGDFCIAPEERSLFGGVLYAVGQMDTQASQRFLEHLVQNSLSSTVRALALKGMAFEDEQFDEELILPFVSLRAHRSEIMSALFALEYRPYTTEQNEDARQRVAPLLAHEDAMVRTYAIRLLMLNPLNLDLILPLASDSEEVVRQSAREALQ